MIAFHCKNNQPYWLVLSMYLGIAYRRQLTVLRKLYQSEQLILTESANPQRREVAAEDAELLPQWGAQHSGKWGSWQLKMRTDSDLVQCNQPWNRASSYGHHQQRYREVCSKQKTSRNSNAKKEASIFHLYIFQDFLARQKSRQVPSPIIISNWWEQIQRTKSNRRSLGNPKRKGWRIVGARGLEDTTRPWPTDST